MNLLKNIRCVFCLRAIKRECDERFKLGIKEYYSYLGFTVTECPKKLEKDPFFKLTEQMNYCLTKENLARIESINLDNHNDKKGE